jgi:beta-glucosidase
MTSTMPVGTGSGDSALQRNLPGDSTESRSALAQLDRRFPDGFVWGAATAAYQIEGAAQADGRGASIWDTFSRQPGRVLHAHNGDDACDHYNRWSEDLDILTWMGLDAYRFSIAWPRWQPEGRGPMEPRGIAFYDKLVDELLQRGIQPWATLYHWDLPQALEDDGGWATRDTAYRFAEYAASVHSVLGDRLRSLTTLNEPWCSAFLGYAAGVHAPGVQDGGATVRAVHHLLLGHGLALQAMRAQGGSTPLGITLNIYPVEAASDRPDDADAARRIDGLANRIFLDPLLRGEYPQDVVHDLAAVSDFSHVQDGDLELIGAPLDFLGENYYTPYVVADPGSPAGLAELAQQAAAGEPVQPEPSSDGWTPGSPWVAAEDLVFCAKGLPATQMGWEVEPQGLRRVLNRLNDEYACPPLYVTENGAAYADELVESPAEAADSTRGIVEDAERTDYIAGHLGACLDAIGDGVDLRGYFLWSLLDNFEWSWGYTRRFGVIHVDFETQERTPKASARWYREATRAKGIPPVG